MADRRANELVARVIDAANLTRDQVADGSGYSAEHVTRVVNGQFAVPPEIIAFLWRRTRDRRLLVAAFGDGAGDLAYLPELLDRQDGREPAHAMATAQVAWGQLLTAIVAPGDARVDNERRAVAAERVVRALVAYVHTLRLGATAA